MPEKDEKEQHMRKPDWLKIKLNTNESYTGLKKMMREKKLHTVCEEARCPNIHECWAVRKTATFMILGDICTRGCRFCAVKTGLPTELDLQEPERVAESVETMGLKHVVITAVARDDLKDGGAAVFAETVRAVRRKNPFCTIEVLPSDMLGNESSLQTLMDARPNIMNHNIETVRRLTPKVRARAKYDRTLEFLRRAKEMHPDIPTKSSLMVGLGETKEEILETMDDLRANNVDILTIGQYLQPTKKHLKVIKYYHPDEFAELKEIAMQKGFSHCEAGPLVRSSYHADEQVNQAQVNMEARKAQGEQQRV
ncbi:lipoyl synthase [Shouchella clausii]|uniref:Lipoyl synthase n=3 Tax=Shouchella TaxID=2893057 RepID=LIPA_SHOC1|nr:MULTISPECIES: lipoyl synthase [Shouchella]Q5WDS6.1 RecName: Full=Lipoyl synthase; AltName: Full=Lip-syn; Short=LS; AltName: Full=Lipoate synthase; AltName: Full=Lipoic acid synthase; AltName: Full=Sulfur insertion protein LipA [Shouchella clausii KSM-K16]MCM3313646.1 lipoyl synthase [Psychrobacillus sp. MER TA 17]ALA54180.1 Lipoate synthase [Shouchella clausii]KKI86348.1 lipoyl synthase [Shouchella clausii]MBU3229273.1 lipoyl synthase [Shouchella clausii]MBU3265505.1 lipoyl synthase [Shouc